MHSSLKQFLHATLIVAQTDGAFGLQQSHGVKFGGKSVLHGHSPWHDVTCHGNNDDNSLPQNHSLFYLFLTAGSTSVGVSVAISPAYGVVDCRTYAVRGRGPWCNLLAMANNCKAYGANQTSEE